ncbi:MAG: MMPL family transporter [bacterium]|nr:MMPL family transporter [bacterium]
MPIRPWGHSLQTALDSTLGDAANADRGSGRPRKFTKARGRDLSIWLAALIVRRHRALLLLAGLIACVSLPVARRLNLDWSVENLFPPGHRLVASYHKLQTRFGGNDICLAVYHDPELWDESGAGLERLQAVSDRLAAVEGVQAVLSLAELHAILEKLRGPISFFNLGQPRVPPLLDPEDSLAQAFASVFEGYTHRRDSHFVSVACLLKQTARDQQLSRGPSSYEATLADIQQILSDLPQPADDGFVAGEPVLVAEGFKMVERDGWRLGIVSSLLVSAVLLFCFRSIRWTLIPLVIVHWSLWVTQAALVALGLQLTMISSTLTAIVTVIGVATTMHLLLRYQDQRRRSLSRPEAMRNSLEMLLVPIFFACVTDAVGFSALMIANVGPVRDFGLMMAIGSMVVFVAIVLLVPGLALLGSWDSDPSTPKLDLVIRLWLRRVLEFCLRRRKLGLSVLTVLFAAALIGCFRMQVETDFTKNFDRNGPLVAGYQVIESELGGAGVWDIMLAAPPVLTAEYFDQVLELEQQLNAIRVASDEGELGLSKVLSIADAIRAADSGVVLRALPVMARLQGMKTAMPDFTGVLLNDRSNDPQGNWLRIMLRSREQVAADGKKELIEAVEVCLAKFTQRSEWRELFPAEPAKSEIAGYHVMLSSLVASVLADQWKCFALATAGIFLVMTLATRSAALGLAALVPNALPILLVLGTLGWMGLRANMGVAMIAAVSLGLSIDSSIHYLMHYRRRLLLGASPLKALRSAQENVGLAVVLATVALIAGFISLCLSEFAPTAVFGTLASLTMLGGLLGNLIVLPLLIAPRK